ncbi:DUF6402 family protein [Acidovorax sp. SUPP2522]|uniref:DUF6402 family protein n=1 Tax=unclassified Acidovorax TaxID=2684926 RepID=UPI0023DE51B2|nr:DUF6402 family protein [Acidovorax sp. SUPP2522]
MDALEMMERNIKKRNFMTDILRDALGAISGNSKKKEPTYQTKVFQLRDIPNVMRSRLGWPVAASLMDRWFNGASFALSPEAKRSAEGNRLSQLPTTQLDETTVTMAWALKFARVQTAVAQLQAKWPSTAGLTLLKRRVVRESRQRTQQCWRFGNLDQPAKIIDDLFQVNYLGVGKSGDPMDDFYGAMGESQLNIAVSGIVTPQSGGKILIEIDELGFYLRDSYDFNDASLISQPLGCWGFSGVECGLSTILTIQIEDSTVDEKPSDVERRKYYVNNGDFQKWRSKNNKGGDFMVLSDVYRVHLPFSQKFTL